MEQEFNEKLFRDCLIEAKNDIQKELTAIKNKAGHKLSSFGVALQKVVDMPNDALIADFELIINRKSSISSNLRNGIQQLFSLAISKYHENINSKK